MKDVPPAYLAAVVHAIQIATRWRAEFPAAAPLFWLPPAEVRLVAPLGRLLADVCKNLDALTLGRKLDAAVRRLTGGGISIVMLEIVLEEAAIPFERVPLERLGLRGPGGSAMRAAALALAVALVLGACAADVGPSSKAGAVRVHVTFDPCP